MAAEEYTDAMIPVWTVNKIVGDGTCVEESEVPSGSSIVYSRSRFDRCWCLIALTCLATEVEFLQDEHTPYTSCMLSRIKFSAVEFSDDKIENICSSRQ